MNNKKKKRLVAIVCIIMIAAMVLSTILASVISASAEEAGTSDESPIVTTEDDIVVSEEDTQEDGAEDDGDTYWESASASSNLDDNTTILDGVYIGEVDVSGMTSAQAGEAVDAYISGLSEKQITLYDSGNESLSATITAGDLGFTWDKEATLASAVSFGNTGNLVGRYKAVQDLGKENHVFTLALKPDADAVSQVLTDHFSELNTDPVDWSLTRESGEFVIHEGTNGVTVDTDAVYDTINACFADGWVESASIELACTTTEPQGSYEELSKVQDVLGKFTTNYSSSASGRKTNVKLGCERISGTVVYPGETFSAYSAMSPVTKENGYELATAYENGTTVDSYGGGICQVSSTLYNAVIRAELEVVKRSGHSMTVSYVDPSADAAVSSSGMDFVFKNNLDAPVYISGYADGSTITFTIYGAEYRESGREVSFESEVTSETERKSSFTAVDKEIGYISMTQGGHDGKVARLWKIVKVNGEEVSREIFNNTRYRVSNAVYEVGVSSDNAEAVKIVKNAISSCDSLADMKAAISEAKSKISAASQSAESTENDEETGGETGTEDGDNAG